MIQFYINTLTLERVRNIFLSLLSRKNFKPFQKIPHSSYIILVNSHWYIYFWLQELGGAHMKTIDGKSLEMNLEL